MSSTPTTPEVTEVSVAINEEEIKSIKEATQKAMVHMYNHFPFWALLIERCRIVCTLTVPTAAVTPNCYILYNPFFFKELSHTQKMFVLAHEVAHVAFRYFDRRGDRDHMLFNAAQDYMINYLLHMDFASSKKYEADVREGKLMPEGLLYSSHVSKLTSEEIYEMLKLLPPPPGEDGSGGGEGGSGNSNNNQQNGQGNSQQNSSGGASARGQKLRDENQQAWQDFKKQLGNQHGGQNGFGGDVVLKPEGVGIEDWEDVEDLLNDGELIREAGGPAPEKYEDWDHIVSQSATRAKMNGRLPGHLEKFVDQFLRPKVHWTRQFQAALGVVCSRDVRMDYTWMVANRRQEVYGNVICPTIAGVRSKGVFAIDTSGSMYCTMQDTDPQGRGKTYLEQAISEVEHLRKQHEIEVYLMNCDAAIHRGEWIKPWEPMPTLKGGGGTSFKPIFKHVDEENLQPDFVVVLTDGWGDYPANKPPYDVIWIMFSDYKPPYGEVIRIET